MPWWSAAMGQQGAAVGSGISTGAGTAAATSGLKYAGAAGSGGVGGATGAAGGVGAPSIPGGGAGGAQLFGVSPLAIGSGIIGGFVAGYSARKKRKAIKAAAKLGQQRINKEMLWARFDEVLKVGELAKATQQAMGRVANVSSKSVGHLEAMASGLRASFGGRENVGEELDRYLTARRAEKSDLIERAEDALPNMTMAVIGGVLQGLSGGMRMDSALQTMEASGKMSTASQQLAATTYAGTEAVGGMQQLLAAAQLDTQRSLGSSQAEVLESELGLSQHRQRLADLHGQLLDLGLSLEQGRGAPARAAVGGYSSIGAYGPPRTPSSHRRLSGMGDAGGGYVPEMYGMIQ